MNDPFHLQRFLNAQDPEYESVLSELRRARKTSHWMWYVFPQLKGLGSSSNASYFGISSRGEAEAYLKHPILGPRLRECTTLVNRAEARSIEAIFGSIDSLKFRSSMTLFAEVDPAGGIFKEALEKYFDGERDPLTLNRLGSP